MVLTLSLLANHPDANANAATVPQFSTIMECNDILNSLSQ